MSDDLPFDTKGLPLVDAPFNAEEAAEALRKKVYTFARTMKQAYLDFGLSLQGRKFNVNVEPGMFADLMMICNPMSGDFADIHQGVIEIYGVAFREQRQRRDA